MIKKSSPIRKIFRIFILFVFLGFCILFIGYQMYVPTRQKWDNCFEQLSTDITENNKILQANEPNLANACTMQKMSIEKADRCFKDVINTNILSQFLLSNHKVERLDEIKALQQKECKDYQ